MIEVYLVTHRPALRQQRVYLREVRGTDELMDLGNLARLVALIDGLMVDAMGRTIAAGASSDLTVAQLDRVFAALYGHLFGDLIESHVACPACRNRSELSFSLNEFRRSVDQEAADELQAVDRLSGPDDDGVFSLGDGTRFRLPTYGDVSKALDTEAPEPLRERCLIASGEASNPETVERAMALLDPPLETQIEVTCVACGKDHGVGFEIAAFLAAALRRERAIVIREIHSLARAYAWSRAEIIDMPRSLRREHVALVLAEAPREGTWA